MTGEHDDLIAEANAMDLSTDAFDLARRLVDALEAAEKKADLRWRMYRDAAAQLSKDQAELERVTHERDALAEHLYWAIVSPEDDAARLGVTLDHAGGRALLAEKEHT